MKMLAQGLSPFKHRADTHQALSDEAERNPTKPKKRRRVQVPRLY